MRPHGWVQTGKRVIQEQRSLVDYATHLGSSMATRCHNQNETTIGYQLICSLAMQGCFLQFDSHAERGTWVKLA